MVIRCGWNDRVQITEAGLLLTESDICVTIYTVGENIR